MRPYSIVLAYMQVNGHAMQCNVTDARAPRRCCLNPSELKNLETFEELLPIQFHRLMDQRSKSILPGPAKRLYSIEKVALLRCAVIYG